MGDIFVDYREGDQCYLNSRDIESLLGSPEEVKKSFSVSRNFLLTLEHSPKKIGRDFYCSGNMLSSLKDGPIEVGGEYECDDNQLTTLIGAPEIIHKGFSCCNNKLTTMDGAPYALGGLDCKRNSLVSFENKSRPSGMRIYGDVTCYENGLTSLHMIHKSLLEITGCFYADKNPNLKSHLLGLLLIEGLTYISIDDAELGKILNHYLADPNPNRKRVMLQCQQELIEAGFEDAAQL